MFGVWEQHQALLGRAGPSGPQRQGAEVFEESNKALMESPALRPSVSSIPCDVSGSSLVQQCQCFLRAPDTLSCYQFGVFLLIHFYFTQLLVECL